MSPLFNRNRGQFFVCSSRPDVRRQNPKLTLFFLATSAPQKPSPRALPGLCWRGLSTQCLLKTFTLNTASQLADCLPSHLRSNLKIQTLIGPLSRRKNTRAPRLCPWLCVKNQRFTIGVRYRKTIRDNPWAGHDAEHR